MFDNNLFQTLLFCLRHSKTRKQSAMTCYQFYKNAEIVLSFITVLVNALRGAVNKVKNVWILFYLEEFVNHSPAARDLQILLVFHQHPAWFINL